MCTAISLTTRDHYFGRNLDLHCSYGEEVCIVPRCFPFAFKRAGDVVEHYAIIGMAKVVDGIPLFYDGANEMGLAMAGLNFPENAFYSHEKDGKDNVAPFELIPWILGLCKNVAEARERLAKINLVDIPFKDSLSLSPLHFIIADKYESIVVEPMKSGMHIYDNPVGVLTNNPPFDKQLFNLNNYRHLSVSNGENRFADNLSLENYCQGLGGLGLPGDVSSMSRFVRAVFGCENSVCRDDESLSVSQVFHLLSSVEMVRGICKIPSGEYDFTVYSACINATKGLYYYTTYENRQINCVNMHSTDLKGT